MPKPAPARIPQPDWARPQVQLPTDAECAELDAEAAAPWSPLAPGDLDRHLAAQPGDVGAAARERLAGSVSTAPLTVADAVPVLRRLLTDPDISAADAAALVLALSRVSDAARDAPASKPLCTLTHAELVQRVAEIDTRRSQLLARIGAAAVPGPDLAAAPAAGPRREGENGGR